MDTHLPTRRNFSLRLAASIPALRMAGISLASAAAASRAAYGEEVSHSAEAIHQEVRIKAAPQKVYEALTDARQFDKIVELSGVLKSGMLPKEDNKPTEIKNEEGGAFALFGGYITGRNIELTPSTRIVQVWRAGGWPRGIYSIARFELVDRDSATLIVFDHTGFPKGDGEHLASGWNEHYWEPLRKLFA
jgi:activator of HSP90 ATPase